MKKQMKSKKSGTPRNAPIAATSKAAKQAERDPRLPAPGTKLTREYRGKTIRVTVLEDGFRHGGKEWRSLSALASELCGNSANGYLWFGLTARGAATSESETAKESERPARPAKRRAPKRSKKIRRAGRDPQPVTPTDAVPEPVQDAVQAAEPATA